MYKTTNPFDNTSSPSFQVLEDVLDGLNQAKQNAPALGYPSPLCLEGGCDFCEMNSWCSASSCNDYDD